MNYNLFKKKSKWVLICYYLIFQNIFLVPTIAQAWEDFDANFYSPNDGDVITENFITVTGVVGAISEEELEEGGICVSYELYLEDYSYYQADDCRVLNGTTEHVNSVLQEGYLIPSPPFPGEYHLILSAKTFDTYAHVKEMTIHYEPCGNECIKNEQNLGPNQQCD